VKAPGLAVQKMPFHGGPGIAGGDDGKEPDMKGLIHPTRNARGSAIVLALMVLSLLTLIGILATRTSNTEVLIAGNEIQRKMAFYNSEGACMEGVELLMDRNNDDLVTRPPVPNWVFEAPGPDLTRVDNWDFDGLNGDDTAVASTIKPGGAVAFSVVERGVSGSMVMTKKTQVRSYAVFGLNNDRTGRLIVEAGKKRKLAIN
jgi:hypothetical protein